MRLAYLSPLPPKRSGIATYSAHLLPELASHFDVVPMDFGAPIADPAAVDLRENASARADLRSFPARLYHLGNNPHYHLEIYRTLRDAPGVVVLHDTVLYYLMAGQGLGGLILECCDNEGPAGVSLALAIRDAAPEHDVLRYATPERYPLLQGVLRHAQGIVVHNHTARRQLEAAFYKGPVAVIPLLSYPVDAALADPALIESRKRAIGLHPDELHIGCFGFIGRTKRIEQIVRALEIAAPRLPKWRLVIVGEGEAPEDLLRESPISDRIVRLGFVNETEWGRYLGAVDLVLNLRHPSMGETSLSLMEAMEYGNACIVTNDAWFSELPDAAVVKIPYDHTEVSELAAQLARLAADPAARMRLGEHARAYCDTQCRPERAATLYAEFIRQVASANRGGSQSMAARDQRSPANWLEIYAIDRVRARIKLPA